MTRKVTPMDGADAVAMLDTDKPARKQTPRLHVDPTTGVRDMTIPQTLMQAFDHMDCGVYAEVVEGGEIAVGDTLRDGTLL